MIKPRVRLRDIADDLGLAVITVSKAIRDHPDISKRTKARVQERIRELNYQPNWAARSLATGKSFEHRRRRGAGPRASVFCRG